MNEEDPPSPSSFGAASERSAVLLCTLQGHEVWQHLPSKRVEFTADADIDADGAYRAYHPISSKGLDHLANAGHEGNWWGVVTHNGKPSGTPVLQDVSDPAPGYYVSSTSYEWKEFQPYDPRRYLDSEKVPFIVVEGFIRRKARGIVLGCKARITNLKSGRSCDCVVGDMGPLWKIGEISIAAANAVGVNGNPRTGGTSQPIIRYELWPDVPAELNGVPYDLIRAVPPRSN